MADKPHTKPVKGIDNQTGSLNVAIPPKYARTVNTMLVVHAITCFQTPFGLSLEFKRDVIGNVNNEINVATAQKLSFIKKHKMYKYTTYICKVCGKWHIGIKKYI